MKRAILLIFVAASACGPGASDKDKNNTFFNNQSNNGPNNTATNNTSPNNTATNNTSPNNTTTNNTAANNTANNTATNNANNTTATNNANNTTTNNANTNNTMGPCIDTSFYGQIGGMEEHDGGVVTNAAPTNDANLGSILSSVPIAPDDLMTAEDEGYRVLDTPISVSNALVTGTAGPAGNARFFLQDSNANVQVFLQVGVAETVRVGMHVSFDATALQNFEGHPQIAELTNFVVESVDNPVPVREANNRAIQPNDYLHVVQVGGVVGTPYDCGGTDCYPMTYPGGEVVFRSKTEFLAPGDCVTFTGPVYSFPGPLQGDMTPVLQLDTINFDWYWRRSSP